MRFSDYQSRVLRVVHKEYDPQKYTRLPDFKISSVTNMIADAWKAGVATDSAIASVKVYLDILTNVLKDDVLQSDVLTGARPLINPHATALKQDEQLRKQQVWDKKHPETEVL